MIWTPDSDRCERCGGWKGAPCSRRWRHLFGVTCCCPVTATASATATTATSTAISEISGCNDCVDSVSALRYSFTLSGLVAGTCAAGFCTALNRTWTVTNTALGLNCRWEESFDTGTSCDGSSVVIAQLIIKAPFSNEIHLDLIRQSSPTVVLAHWDKTEITIDCLDSHVLTIDAGLSDPRCGSYPSSVTIAPA